MANRQVLTRMKFVLALVLWLAVVASASSIHAQPGTVPAATVSGEPAAEYKEGKSLRAHWLTGAPPQIDGKLEDDVWQNAASTEGLIQWEPDNMAPLSERTVIQVAYDDRYIYVGIRCYDREPQGVRGPLSRRDEANGTPTDLIAVGFDPRHDHLTGYVFMTNPAAVQNDFFFFNDDGSDRDYDAVWEVSTDRTAEAWTAEFRIPFSQMRFGLPASGESVWGFRWGR